MNTLFDLNHRPRLLHNIICIIVQPLILVVILRYSAKSVRYQPICIIDIAWQ